MLRRPDKTQMIDEAATVLVVDDTATARFLVASTLDRLGFSILCAVDGTDALLTICNNFPDAIVTDWEMPGLNGQALINAVRSHRNAAIRELPIIVCSSKFTEQSPQLLRRLGADAIVPKPIDVRLLAATALELFPPSEPNGSS